MVRKHDKRNQSKRSQATSKAEEQVLRLPRFTTVHLAGLMLMILLAGVIWVAWWLQLPGNFPIRSVQVSGRMLYVDENRLRNRVSENINHNFFMQNIDDIRTSLLQLPWIENVYVRRVWPDALRIEVSEHQPFAIWEGGGLVNTRGQWFDADSADVKTGLPVLSGPKSLVHEVAEKFSLYHRQFQELGLNLKKVKLDKRRAWSLMVQDGFIVRLGRKNVSDRLQRFQRSYQSTLKQQKQQIQAIDMRYTNGFAVQWKAAGQGEQA